MKTQLLVLSLALSGVLATTSMGAFAADPVAEAAKLSTVEKNGTREDARVQRKAAVASGRESGDIPSNEWKRNQNQQQASEGTREERKAERKATREQVRQQAKAGEIPPPSAEWTGNQNTPKKLDGNHESRQAQRQEKREEMRDLNRQGKIPVSNEATVNVAR